MVYNKTTPLKGKEVAGEDGSVAKSTCYSYNIKDSVAAVPRELLLLLTPTAHT